MFDRSTQSLIAVNLINILMAVFFRWSVYDVMLVYWFQSVSIGIFTFYNHCRYLQQTLYQDYPDPLNDYGRRCDQPFNNWRAIPKHNYSFDFYGFKNVYGCYSAQKET